MIYSKEYDRDYEGISSNFIYIKKDNSVIYSLWKTMLRTSYVVGALEHSPPKVRRIGNSSSAGELSGVGVGVSWDRTCSSHVLGVVWALKECPKGERFATDVSAWELEAQPVRSRNSVVHRPLVVWIERLNSCCQWTV
jgi:hypothetical protein